MASRSLATSFAASFAASGVVVGAGVGAVDGVAGTPDSTEPDTEALGDGDATAVDSADTTVLVTVPTVASAVDVAVGCTDAAPERTSVVSTVP